MTIGNLVSTNTTRNLRFKLFGWLFAATVGGSFATAVVNPSLLPAALAASGGFLSGSALVNEVRRRREAEDAEDASIATAFKYLYEQNRGFVSPDQLAFQTTGDLESISLFLESLAAENQGIKVVTDKGYAYSFPHPENILNKLTENSLKWVEAQKEPLLTEIQELQNRLNRLIALTQQQQQQNLIKNAAADAEDPWRKLL